LLVIFVAMLLKKIRPRRLCIKRKLFTVMCTFDCQHYRCLYNHGPQFSVECGILSRAVKFDLNYGAKEIILLTYLPLWFWRNFYAFWFKLCHCDHNCNLHFL